MLQTATATPLNVFVDTPVFKVASSANIDKENATPRIQKTFSSNLHHTPQQAGRKAPSLLKARNPLGELSTNVKLVTRVGPSSKKQTQHQQQISASSAQKVQPKTTTSAKTVIEGPLPEHAHLSKFPEPPPIVHDLDIDIKCLLKPFTPFPSAYPRPASSNSSALDDEADSILLISRESPEIVFQLADFEFTLPELD